jgi:1-acyl-sn-glycerol-3-phosphate acyltransferase
MNRLLKIIFFGLFIKPLVTIGLGLNIVGRKNLPMKGPAILAANHNSHLDTLVLMSMYPLSIIHKIRPVAAADYFLSNKFVAWFSLKIIGIIPLDRSGKTKREMLFSSCHKALDNDQILLIFPEGTRGKPEQISRLKKGIYYLIKDRNDTQVTPVVMHGLGRSLPRGEALFVPFNCDVIIGEKIKHCATFKEFFEIMAKKYVELINCCITRHDED